MAVTISNLDYVNYGSEAGRIFTLTFDNSYPNGGIFTGEQLTPQQIGLTFFKKINVHGSDSNNLQFPGYILVLPRNFGLIATFRAIINLESEQLGTNVDFKAGPVGDQCFLQFTEQGLPYIASNLVTAQDEWAAFNFNEGFLKIHNTAAPSGFAIKIDDTQTNPEDRLSVNNTATGSDSYLPLTNGSTVKVRHDAAAPGVDLFFDTGIGQFEANVSLGLDSAIFTDQLNDNYVRASGFKEVPNGTDLSSFSVRVEVIGY